MYIVRIFDEETKTWFNATTNGNLFIGTFMHCLGVVIDYHRIGVISKLKKYQ